MSILDGEYLLFGEGDSMRVAQTLRLLRAAYMKDAPWHAVSECADSLVSRDCASGRKMLDVTSPMWVRGDTLFIPSVFAQYNNSWEADPVQDEKTPLLRSMVRRPIGSSLA